MFSWAVFSLVIAIVAALFGFGGVVSGMAAWLAKSVFVAGLVLFLALLVSGRRPPPR